MKNIRIPKRSDMILKKYEKLAITAGEKPNIFALGMMDMYYEEYRHALSLEKSIKEQFTVSLPTALAIFGAAVTTAHAPEVSASMLTMVNAPNLDYLAASANYALSKNKAERRHIWRHPAPHVRKLEL